jgi:RimJ/RimL family protein N-acetyltransferase
MLEGNTVRLRKLEPNDLERVLRWINDSEVTQFLAARYPMSRAAEERWLERMTSQPPEDGLALAIEVRADVRHIGTIGLSAPSREHRRSTLGIMIGDKECWSRGYGTDAVLTLLRHAFEFMNLHRIDLRVWSENERAIACYRRCGFALEGRLRQDLYQSGRYHDVLVMSVLQPEFFAMQGRAAPETAGA